ncbi:HGGxSTG domain-containing protein [Xanthobacteraceae bacterium Astr-EGSB]|uniref:HGGxSTG domain-containing protein n=1 Tax=Astrobacterium formosum TaxID=3069710 RepID=UPI0027B3A5C5|nr:HGGxSTG domain-containing protein [Xanthobacteraceae bacterium Astr-EGSB]
MLTSRRCGAKTRAGTSCRAPAVRGKNRCRMHGGAAGSGAPRGNRNAELDGYFRRENISHRRAIRRLMRESRALIRRLT